MAFQKPKNTHFINHLLKKSLRVHTGHTRAKDDPAHTQFSEQKISRKLDLVKKNIDFSLNF